MQREGFATRLFQRASAVACFATFATTACSEGASETTARHRDAIWRGERSGESDDGVVFLVADTATKTSQCTATLVAPNLVITAKHCVVEFPSESFSCTSSGELTSGSEGGVMGALLPPEDISFVVGADARGKAPSAWAVQIFSVPTPSICRNDIAMVLLDRELPDLPLVPMRLGKGNSRGERLRVVGYGADHNNAFAVRNTLSDQRISQVGSSQFLTDADPVPPRTFMTLGASLCIGDSGGPAFTENEAITAVWSQLVGGCGDEDARNFFTQIAPFEDTIVRPAFEAAGYEPLLEVETGSGSGGAPTAEGGAGGEPAGPAAGGSETGAGGAESGAGGTETSAGGTGAGGGAGAGTDEGGRPSTPAAGEAGVGGESDREPPTYRGPRKSGGLKCEFVPGARQNWHASVAALLLGLAWAARRARSNERGS